MHCKIILILVASALLFSFVNCEEHYEENNVHSYRGLDAKSMLTSIASNLMSRGYGAATGSQVVSLNLTNLLVLVLLKALIFAAGSLGAGTWKGGYARSADGEEHIVTEEEILMYLSYLTGAPGNNVCLQNISCKQPYHAKRYIAAGEMLLRASKMIQPDGSPSNEYTLQEVKDAVNYGVSGGDCNARYTCGVEKIKKR